MKIPLFDSKRNSAELTPHLQRAMDDVLARGSYLFGPNSRELERELGDFLGVPPERVVTCHSGTDALILSLLAAGIGAGDEVVAPASTATPTAAAICAVGATPVFCDIDPETWLLNPLDCVSVLTPRTKAVIPVHLYGNIVPITELREALVRAGHGHVRIVEDCAQSFGGIRNGVPTGVAGDFGAFSFYPTKNLGAAGDGGAVVARTDTDARALRALAFYGQVERNHALLARGINSRLDEIQAGVLRSRLRTFPENLNNRARLIAKYREGCAGLPISFQAVSPGSLPAWHLAVIRLEDEQVRDALRTALSAAEIETLIHYPLPLHLQPAFRTEQNLPESERLARSILTLPFSHLHATDDVERVIRELRAFFSSK